MTDQEALQTIERICGDDFCEALSMEMDGAGDSKLKTAEQKLSLIYCIAHSMFRENRCYKVHDGWRELAEQTRREVMAE